MQPCLISLQACSQLHVENEVFTGYLYQFSLVWFGLVGCYFNASLDAGLHGQASVSLEIWARDGSSFDGPKGVIGDW